MCVCMYAKNSPGKDIAQAKANDKDSTTAAEKLKGWAEPLTQGESWHKILVLTRLEEVHPGAAACSWPHPLGIVSTAKLVLHFSARPPPPGQFFQLP